MSISYTADQLQKKFQGPPGGTGFARIAETLREEGRHEEAVALCQAGLSRKPHDLTGHLVLGKCYLDMDRLDEAREHLEGVLRQDPRCLSAMHLLARIMSGLQWGEAAAAYYRSILELEPWDTETLARFRDVSQAGAAGLAPSPEARSLSGTPAAPLGAFPSDSAATPAPEVEEFDLNQVTGFPPTDSNPGDLAGALEEVSLEDALSEPVEQPRAFAPAQTPPAFEEPKALDILIEDSPAAVPGAEAPAPISGDDVGDRLDSLFGAEEELPLVAPPAPSLGLADAEAGRPDADFANATLQLKALRGQEAPPATDIGNATTISGPVADFGQGNAGFGGEPVSPRDTSVFAEGELLPPEERVSGEDIEARLDDLFSLHDTSTQPVMKAIPDEALFAAPEATTPEEMAEGDFLTSAPEAVATWSGAASPDADPATAERPATDAPAAEPFGNPEPESANSADEDGFLAAETGASTQSMPAGDMVTGQDVADKLSALFGEEPPRPGTAPDESPAFDLIASGSASWAAARPAADEAEASATDTGEIAAATDPASRAQSFSDPAMPGGTATEVPGGMAEEDIAPAWDEGLEASQPPSSDLMSTESMLPRGPALGQSPPITGQDIEDRLDSLFDLADEGASSGAMPRVEDVRADFDPRSADFPADATLDADRTMIMPAVQESPFAWSARQGEAPGAEAETPEPPLGPMAALPGAGDTMFIRNEDDFQATPVAPGAFGASDTVGLEMVDGADIADRLDRIFAPEDGDPRATLPVEETDLPMSEPAGLETGEIPLDEVTLFAQEPADLPPTADEDLLVASGAAASAAEIMVSGDDIDSRLSEIFETPGAQAIRPMEDEEPETPHFLANPESAPTDRTPAADAGTHAPETGSAEAHSPALLQDEEEGSPEEDENAPQSAAGANVATVTLAEIYFQQGLREQALQIYRQLLEREPGNDSVRKRIQEIEASKPEPGTGPGSDPRRPRPGLKVPKRKK